jgi:hypothetical protein
VGRSRVVEPRTEQLLVRLTAAEMEILEAIAHLERVTPNQYARGLLQHHLAALAHQPHVAADLANRRAYEADTAATTSMSDTRDGDSSTVRNATVPPVAQTAELRDE